MIKLMRSTFYKEEETKKKLCDFIINSKMLSMGEKCKEFEEQFATYQGRRYAVLFNSGSSANLALIQSLLNLGMLKREDKVGFSAITWATNVMPIIQLGLDPIPIDISLENLNVNSKNIGRVLENNSLRAVFLTNLLGFSGDLDNIKNLCNEKGIILLEDNCEALGSEYKGIKLGNFGIASTFSFFVGHHMSTIEGGIVCTDNKDIFDMLLMVRAHGWSRNLNSDMKKKLAEKHNINNFFEKYTFYNLGFNLRPTEITGFLGLEQIKYLNETREIRRRNFEIFIEIASKNKDILPLNIDGMSFISSFSYPLLFKDKEGFEKYKKIFEPHVEIRPIVGGNITEQPFFKDYLREKQKEEYECPNAFIVNRQCFYFTSEPELTEDEIKLICNLLEYKQNL